MYPSVRNLPISKKRKEFIIQNLIKEFHKTAIGRKTVNLKRVDSTEGLFYLGVNFIVDKIWFVDYVGETTYAYQNIGYMEGKNIALYETELIVKKILDEMNLDESKLEISSQIDEASIEKAVSILDDRGKTCNAILTNVHEIFTFWWLSRFQGVSKTESPFGLEGYYADIPVYWSKSIPENVTLFLNKNVGDFLVGQDISADVREIEDEVVEAVIREIPKINENNVKEKVRLVAGEFIRFDFKEKDAGLVVKSKKNT